MDTTKKLIIINLCLFIIIAIGLAVYVVNYMFNVNIFAEQSFVSGNNLIKAINESQDEIESQGGNINDMPNEFMNLMLAKRYYTIVCKNKTEIYTNLSANQRTKRVDNAFERSLELKNDGLIIANRTQIYVLYDSLDPSISYHIVDINYNVFSGFVSSQIVFYVIVMTLVIIVMIAMSMIQLKASHTPLRKLSEATHELREGNLDFKIESNYKGTIGVVLNDFEALRQTLKESKEERDVMAKDREEYIAGITHDLKTPLTSILGFSKGLIDGIANTKDKTDKYLHIIYNTAQHMDGLIEKLKEFSKLDSDKIDFNFNKVNVVTVINDFVYRNAAVYHANDVILTARRSSPLVTQESTENDYMALLDVEEFNRVLSNIINNTVKYKRKGMASSEIIISRGYGQIIITIKDDGPGVKDKELNDIFDCFYRGDASRTRPTEGSGLGLYVVSKIIAAHNGTVKAVNDNGLKIIITLPEVRK